MACRDDVGNVHGVFFFDPLARFGGHREPRLTPPTQAKSVYKASMSTLAPLALLSAVVPMGSSVTGWTLQEGDGPRSCGKAVLFERPFSTPPVVQLGVVGVDSSKDHNLRVRVRAEDITANGFTIVVETWLHTQLWSVDVSWLAIGL